MPSAPEYRRERDLMIEEARREGVKAAYPTYSVLGKKYGSWSAARADAESDLPSSDDVDLDDPRRPAGLIYTEQQIFEALRWAFSEIGNPLSLQRFEIWRDRTIADAQARWESVRIPSHTIIQKRYDSWYTACTLAIGEKYVPLQRRREPRPLEPRADEDSAELQPGVGRTSTSRSSVFRAKASAQPETTSCGRPADRRSASRTSLRWWQPARLSAMIRSRSLGARWSRFRRSTSPARRPQPGSCTPASSCPSHLRPGARPPSMEHSPLAGKEPPASGYRPGRPRSRCSQRRRR